MTPPVPYANDSEPSAAEQEKSWQDQSKSMASRGGPLLSSSSAVSIPPSRLLKLVFGRSRSATKSGKGAEKAVKQVELEALLAVPEGFGDDVSVDPNFHARRLPDRAWRRSKRCDGLEAVIPLHRLREVQALVEFTRFEAETPDIHGEYETDVERAQ